MGELSIIRIYKFSFKSNMCLFYLFQYYRFIFSDVHDPGEDYMGLHEIEFYGMKANNVLKRFGTFSDGRHYYGLPWQTITNVQLGGLLPPEPYEIMGLHSKVMPETYVGAENL